MKSGLSGTARKNDFVIRYEDQTRGVGVKEVKKIKSETTKHKDVQNLIFLLGRKVDVIDDVIENVLVQVKVVSNGLPVIKG